MAKKFSWKAIAKNCGMTTEELTQIVNIFENLLALRMQMEASNSSRALLNSLEKQEEDYIHSVSSYADPAVGMYLENMRITADRELDLIRKKRNNG